MVLLQRLKHASPVGFVRGVYNQYITITVFVSIPIIIFFLTKDLTKILASTLVLTHNLDFSQKMIVFFQKIFLARLMAKKPEIAVVLHTYRFTASPLLHFATPLLHLFFFSLQIPCISTLSIDRFDRATATPSSRYTMFMLNSLV